MKLFSTVLFLLATEMCSAARMKMFIVLNNCENQVDLTFYGEGDAPSSTALKEGEIMTKVIPLYSDADLKTAAGEWEMYCIGLGEKQDPAGGQICTSLFVLEDGNSEGQMSGTSVYDVGSTEMDIILTGGIGQYDGASGKVVATYDKMYTVAFSMCMSK